MLFNSFVFLGLFLPITYGVFWSLRTAASRYVWLTITGYVFYGYWDPRFCLLMAFSTLVSYVAGRSIGSATSDMLRRRYLWTSIGVDLALLGFFKYTNFVLESFRQLAERIGWQAHLPHLDIVLPIGISFYTFHTISYIVDVYRGTVRPTRNVFEYAAYVSLFSQLVAGPIVRFRQIEADLEQLGSASRSRWMAKGVAFFGVGMFSKVVVADSLASIADPLWARAGDLGLSEAWLAVGSYTGQLYFDFAGYSTMAVGLGYLFGLRIPDNFNSPYKATDPSDFWRRWHISLSQCLRDYVYIPLGGNRGGPVGTYWNLLATMLIGGLWHGANWTFIVWGAYHGGLLCLHRLGGRWWDQLPGAVRVVLMLLLTMIGWTFFRAATLADAGTLLSAMFGGRGAGAQLAPMAATAVTLLALISAMVLPNVRQMFPGERPAWWPFALAVAGLGAAIGVMTGMQSSPFLYFQF